MQTKQKTEYQEFSREIRDQVYSRDGYYFITIASSDGFPYFGEVVNGQMRMSVSGKYVEKQIEWLHEQYAFVTIDSYCIMPNHVHLILLMNYNTYNVSLQNHKQRSVTELVDMLKETSKRLIHLFGNRHFEWQRRSFEHAIRAPRTLESLRDFIRYNPRDWELEKSNDLDLFM
jgi:REP element-mobilizing transposase RayT